MVYWLTRAVVAACLGTVAATLLACGSHRSNTEPTAPEVEALVAEAAEALRGKRLTDGLGAARQAVNDDSSYAEARFVLGRLLAETGRLHEARRHYAAVVRRQPNFAGVQLNIGNTYYLERRYRDAARHYRRATEANDPRAWHALGAAFAKLGKADSARIALEHSLRLAPSSAAVNDALAEWHELDGDFHQALEYATRAVEYDASDPDYRYRLGALLGRAGRLEEAVQILGGVLKDRPWDHRAAFNLGRTLQNLGRSEEATPLLQRAAELEREEAALNQIRARAVEQPDDFTLRVQLGDALRIAGRHLDALNEYRVASALRPANLSLRNNIATLHLQTGDTLAALNGYRSVISADSTFVQTWINLAVFYTDVGNSEQARSALARAARLAPDHPVVHRLREIQGG